MKITQNLDLTYNPRNLSINKFFSRCLFEYGSGSVKRSLKEIYRFLTTIWPLTFEIGSLRIGSLAFMSPSRRYLVMGSRGPNKANRNIVRQITKFYIIVFCKILINI